MKYTHDIDSCEYCNLLSTVSIHGLEIKIVKGDFEDTELFKTLVSNRLFNIGCDTRGLDKSTTSREFHELKMGWCDAFHEKIILAFINNEPIGYVFQCEEGDVNRFVKKSYRKMGICRILLDYAFPGVTAAELKKQTAYYHDELENELVTSDEHSKRVHERAVKILTKCDVVIKNGKKLNKTQKQAMEWYGSLERYTKHYNERQSWKRPDQSQCIKKQLDKPY